MSGGIVGLLRKAGPPRGGRYEAALGTAVRKWPVAAESGSGCLAAADLSSLLVGAVDPVTLHRLGPASISPRLDRSPRKGPAVG